MNAHQNQLFDGELAEGKYDQNKPKKRLNDCIWINMKSLGMNRKPIETLASDQVAWRTIVWSGVNAFEETRKTLQNSK